MMKIDKFYDSLLRNSLPQKRVFVQNKDDLLAIISRVINKDIYVMMRNRKCFVSR